MGTKIASVLMTLFVSFLFVPMVMGTYVHVVYDWEGDDTIESLPATLPSPMTESCYGCHYGGMFPQEGFERKKCEDCHLKNESTGRPNGPYEFYDLGHGGPGRANFTLRDDYDAPLVYSHLSSKVIPPSEFSSCLSYNPDTGEGVCHGVSNGYEEQAGGSFAFNLSKTKEFPEDEPYLRTNNNFLPESLDCLFCHHQSNEDVRRAWGDAEQIKISGLFRHYNSSQNDSCYPCHVKNEIRPTSFHSPGFYVERKAWKERGFFAPAIIVLILLVSLGGIKIFKKRKRLETINDRTH